MTNVTPSAIIAYGTNDCVILSMLYDLKKLAFKSAKIRTRTIKAATIIKFCLPFEKILCVTDISLSVFDLSCCIVFLPHRGVFHNLFLSRILDIQLSGYSSFTHYDYPVA